VAAQVYDAANQRLAIASHGGTLKMFSVDGVDLIELWTVAEPSQAIPISLVFFGGGNQSLLIHKIENGEMTCRDSTTSAVLWQNGHAVLSPREDFLLVHNLTESYMQLHRFPGSLAEAVFPVNFKRQITIQGAWAEDGKIAVCGSDHDTIYVLNAVTQEIVQQLPANGRMQTIATAQLSTGHHVIIGGSSSGSFCASVWMKQPGQSIRGPAVRATSADSWSLTVDRAVILFLVLAMMIQFFLPALKTALVFNTGTPHHVGAELPAVSGVDSRFSRTKKLTYFLKDIEDSLNSLRAEVLAIGNAPARPDDNTLSSMTTALSHIRQAVLDQRTRLIPIEASKIPAVVESYRAVTVVYNDVSSLLETTLRSWEVALHNRIAEPQAAAGSVFDSGGFIVYSNFIHFTVPDGRAFLQPHTFSLASSE
ncbi:hypothetical protein C0992_006946, partial [Termitomyces sp. T32_za158]